MLAKYDITTEFEPSKIRTRGLPYPILVFLMVYVPGIGMFYHGQ